MNASPIFILLCLLSLLFNFLSGPGTPASRVR